MTISPEIIHILLVLMSLAMAFAGIMVLYSGTKAAHDWKRRIRNSNGIESNTLRAAQPLRAHPRWQQRLDHLGDAIKPRQQKELSIARSRLLQAGYRRPNAVNFYYLVKYGMLLLVAGMILLLLSGALKTTSPDFSTLDIILYIVGMAAIGYFAPDYWLKLKIKQRKEQIGRGFPDALDLLVLCIESGLGIDAAMNRSADDIRYTHPLLSQELRLVTDGIRAGQPRQSAFEALNQRVDLDDVHSFTSLISQTEKLGVSITQSIKTIAEAMRTKRRNEAERLAAQLPVKLLVPVVIFIFPGLFIIILLPAAIGLYNAFSSAQ